MALVQVVRILIAIATQRARHKAKRRPATPEDPNKPSPALLGRLPEAPWGASTLMPFEISSAPQLLSSELPAAGQRIRAGHTGQFHQKR